MIDEKRKHHQAGTWKNRIPVTTQQRTLKRMLEIRKNGMIRQSFTLCTKYHSFHCLNWIFRKTNQSCSVRQKKLLTEGIPPSVTQITGKEEFATLAKLIDKQILNMWKALAKSDT